MSNERITYTLEQLNEELNKYTSKEIKNCTRCKLHKTRINPVIGEGNTNTDIMFVGEAPGKSEDKSGYPFVGKSGKILSKLLSSIDLSREEVYITNVVKCRPPNNRNPLKEEIKKCSLHLDKQIVCIDPKIICPLGSFSTKYILRSFGFNGDNISNANGELYETEKGLKIIPLYHPAAIFYKRERLKNLTEGFKKLNEEIIKCKKK